MFSDANKSIGLVALFCCYGYSLALKDNPANKGLIGWIYGYVEEFDTLRLENRSSLGYEAGVCWT